MESASAKSRRAVAVRTRSPFLFCMATMPGVFSKIAENWSNIMIDTNRPAAFATSQRVHSDCNKRAREPKTSASMKQTMLNAACKPPTVH